MDELIDILDAYGNPTGKTCLKSEAHAAGLFHPTAHIWLYTANGKILFQQRAKNKDTFPSLWDVSVAGHIGAGEPIVEAALREVAEEIGLQISASDLTKIGIFKSEQRHSEHFLDREFHHTFLCELGVALGDLTQQESEVANLKLLGLKDFKSRLKKNELQEFVPHQPEYYNKILVEIERRL